jgi:hypothetical protein
MKVIDLVHTDDDESNSLRSQPKQQKQRRLQSMVHTEEDIISISESIVVMDEEEDQKVDSSSKQRSSDLVTSQIYDVFPDINHDHAEYLLKNQSYDIPKVVQIILEEGSYPKADAPKSLKRHCLIAHRHEKTYQTYLYDFMSESSFEPDKTYCEEAKSLLKQEFRIISLKAIEVHFSRAKCHYAICHHRIWQLLMLRDSSQTNNDEDDWTFYSRLQRALCDNGRINDEQLNKLVVPGELTLACIKLNKQRKYQIVTVTHSILQAEMQFVEAKQNEWKDWINRFAKRRHARIRALETGSTIECDCCFGDVAVEELVQCQGGHLFCCSCLQKYSEIQIFSNEDFGMNHKTNKPATDLLCLSGCGQGFALEFLEKALPQKVLEKYHEMQFRSAVNSVEMDDLWYV